MEDRGRGASCGHKNHDASYRIPDNTFFFDPFELYDSCFRITKYPDNQLSWNESNESVRVCQTSCSSHKLRKQF
jgi:hypothetical protein